MSSAFTAGAGSAGSRALLRACLRYWPAVAARASSELRRCERSARTIPDRQLRRAALTKLRREPFNPQLAATFATLAPRRHRPLVARATVCLQVAYDYLDLLTERPGMSVEQAGRLLEALPAAAAGRPWWGAAGDPQGGDPLEGGDPLVGGDRLGGGGYPEGGDCLGGGGYPDDGGYLQSVLDPVRRAVTRLPAAAAVRESAIASAERCARAQALSHCGGEDEVRRLAEREAAGGPMGWQEALAAATASVLCLHALIAAAADPESTPAHAAEIESIYRSIGALAMLDSLLDRREDRASGQRGYLERYAGAEEMADRLAAIARSAVADAAQARNGAHHLMTLAGLLAHYCSATAAPGADAEAARIVTARLRAELGPLLGGAMAVMRGWRAAKAGRRVALCMVSRGQPSAPAGALACSGGSCEADVPGSEVSLPGERGS